MARGIEHKVTNLGLAWIEKVIAGHPVNFTKGQIGTGVAPDGQDIAEYTQLINYYDDTGLAQPAYQAGNVHVELNYTNQNVTQTVRITELGLFALDPDLGEILIAYTTFGEYPDPLAPAGQTPMTKLWTMLLNLVNPPSSMVAQVSAAAMVPASDVTDAATPGKILRVNQEAKLPVSITGDAQSIAGKTPADFAAVQHSHGAATQQSDGFMAASDKTALDTLAGRVNQSVSTTASPTFQNITVAGVINGAKYEA